MLLAEPIAKPSATLTGPRWGGIFDITLSDAYGAARNRNRYVNDDEPLDLDGRETLCLVWSSETLDKFWNSEAERNITLHASMKRKDEDEDDANGGEIHLKDCIQLFMAEETLGANDMWYCSSCKEHRQAHKKMDIWKLPPVLVIHLKRFSYKSRYNREKIDTLVDFPLEGLDFTDLLPTTAETNDKPPIYDLFAVSNHYGSMGGGHYTAYAKHRDNGKWYHYDDRSVSAVGQAEGVKTAAAYLLFYRRRDMQQFQTKFSTNPSIPTLDSQAAAATSSNQTPEHAGVDVESEQTTVLADSAPQNSSATGSAAAEPLTTDFSAAPSAPADPSATDSATPVATLAEHSATPVATPAESSATDSAPPVPEKGTVAQTTTSDSA